MLVDGRGSSILITFIVELSVTGGGGGGAKSYYFKNLQLPNNSKLQMFEIYNRTQTFPNSKLYLPPA